MKALISVISALFVLSSVNIAAQDSLLVDSIKREYFIHLPAGYDGNDSVPLIIALHNAYGNAAAFESMTNLSVKSDSEGFRATPFTGEAVSPYQNAVHGTVQPHVRTGYRHLSPPSSRQHPLFLR